MSVEGVMTLALNVFHTDDDAATFVEEKLPTVAYQIKDGTSANEMDAIWQAQGSVTGTGTTYDLTSLTDSFGNALEFTGVKFMYLRISSTSTGAGINIGGASSDAFATWLADPADEVFVVDEGVFFLYNPRTTYDVNGTNYNLKLTSSGGTLGFDLIIGGIKA